MKKLHTRHILSLVLILSHLFLLSCSSNGSSNKGLSKEEEEAIVRTEATKLAHYNEWRHASYEFFLRDVHDLLWNFQYMPLHRWDFGDYKAAEADKRLSAYKEQAYEIVWNTDDDVFLQSYAEYTAKYYEPAKYHYVNDDERIFADIYYAAYENASPSLLEIATFIVGKFKVNTPVPVITAIQQIKSKEYGSYWEVYFDKSDMLRVKVIQKVDGSYGIDKSPEFR